ncbi:hypothetical protein OG216_19610 [Streptomycetaceae bacterium NBC_01309]
MSDDLTKWPRLLVTGSSVTPQQTEEILIRTANLLLLDGNDKAWTQTVYGALRLAPAPNGNATTKSIRATAEDLGVLPLRLLYTSRIASTWIGGPHGWCNWDGTIGCANYNIGEWPARETVLRDWELIADAFPYLDLTAQLLADEGQDGAPVVAQWRVADGRVAEESPGPRITEPVELTEQDLLTRTLFRGGERGVPAAMLYAAVDRLRAARGDRRSRSTAPEADIRQTSGEGTEGQAVWLPAFSADDAVCAKCSHTEALTTYRPAQPQRLSEFNGRAELRGPLPERLERQCQRCDFTWDEALHPPTAAQGGTSRPFDAPCGQPV